MEILIDHTTIMISDFRFYSWSTNHGK